MTVVAETERLILRQVVRTDAVPLRAVFCDPEVMRFSEGIRTENWVDRWVEEAADKHYPNWGFGPWAAVLKSGQTVIGYCGLFRTDLCKDGEAEIGYRLSIPHWGHGYAREIVPAACAAGFEQFGLSRILGLVDPQNHVSVRVLKALGMRYDGEIMKDWYDHPDHLYSLSRRTGR